MEPSLQDLGDKIDDVARLVSRQSATLAELADTRATTGPDAPLLVELHTLYVDALTCADTARSRRERAAFGSLAAGLARLLAGRGATIVTPQQGDAFTATSMEAAEVVPTADATLDRTVAALREPGLQVGTRSVRPARVAVHRAT